MPRRLGGLGSSLGRPSGVTSQTVRDLAANPRTCPVLIGAGTMRAAPDSLWTPAYIYPDASAGLAELRNDLGRRQEPRLAILAASGHVDPHHPALEAGALVLTTSVGASKLNHRLPSASTVLSLGNDRAIDLREVISALRIEGHQLILSEGGPRVIGGLLEASLLDELLLTFSPILAGRSDVDRPGLVEGVALLPSRVVAADLLSIRRDGSVTRSGKSVTSRALTPRSTCSDGVFYSPYVPSSPRLESSDPLCTVVMIVSRLCLGPGGTG